MNYDLEKLRGTGQINDYFYDKLKRSWLFMNSDLHDDFGEFMHDVIQMSQMGISSKEDELVFRRIQHDVPDIISEISEDDFHITDYYMDELIKEMYNNHSEYNLSDLLNVFCSVAKAAQKVGIPLSEKANQSCIADTVEKTAYPQAPSGDNMKKPYDISKWIDATKDIYSRVYRLGLPFSKAMEHVTANWDKMEKLDYKHWLRFYNEGVPSKYPKLAGLGFRKSAQGYVSDNGFSFPLASLLERERNIEPEQPKKPDRNEVKDKIESHRKRILSRLSSAEKLLTSVDGQDFAGEEQEFMLKLLQDLKRKVQTANKISLNSSIFEDFIYRTANYMGAKGSKKGQAFFVKIAQDPFTGLSPDLMGGAGGSTAPAGESSGNPVQDTRDVFREMKEMAENLEDTGIIFYDADDDPDERKEKFKKEKPAPAAPADPAQTSPAQAKSASSDFDEIVVLAQDMPEEEISIGEAETAPPEDRPSRQRPRVQPEAQPDQGGQLTVHEDEVFGPEDNTDDIIDEALEQVTVHDAINLLEMLVSIYQQREVPRQLSKLDMVMDQLGLAAYFPQLGEAQSKALDSNQYVSTRLEDMLAKLKGSVESSEANSWVQQERTVDPATQNVQKDLKEKQEKDEKRKEMRREKSDAKLMGDDKKEVQQQAEQELAGPTNIETGTPVQVR